ncbi:MAG: cyclopropane-fatty-acyl-phospholipid synthase family protein [Fimbriimonadaceae bacterium]
MMEQLQAQALAMAESGRVPEKALRWGIRWGCANRLRRVEEEFEDYDVALGHFVSNLKSQPIAEATDIANEQHYELPAEFFRLVLGPNLKYSGCDWDTGATSLAEAERESLSIIAQRAQLGNNQDILELGCGWGSLSLYMASAYPTSRVTVVSNSAHQREFIENLATTRNITNLKVLTCDINDFEPSSQFDRIVTVEMLEHVRNYESLFQRTASWLRPNGLMFAHIFMHERYPYFFETEGAGNWMGKHFFTGGVMPSHNLFESVQSSMTVEQKWRINGSNYQKTADAWLSNLNTNKARILSILRKHYGADAALWFARWQLFFLACSELFGFDNGRQWGVGHYLMRPR